MLSLGRLLGARARRRKQSALARMQDGERARSPRVTLAEDTAGGVAPAFQARRLRAAAARAADRGGRARRLAGVAAHGARVRRSPTNGANGDEIARVARPWPAATLADARRARGARHRPLHRQPLVPQLLRPPRVPHHRHDALRDVLGRERRDRRAGRRAALRRHALPHARREPRGADARDRAHPRRRHLPSRQLASVRLPGALVSEMAFTL